MHVITGKNIAEVARELGRSRQYVNFWWNRRGEERLIDKPRPGRPQGPRAPNKGRFAFEMVNSDEGDAQDLTTRGRVLDDDEEEIEEDEDAPDDGQVSATWR